MGMISNLKLVTYSNLLDGKKPILLSKYFSGPKEFLHIMGFLWASPVAQW